MAKQFPPQPKGFNPFGELIGLEFTGYGDGRSRCRLQVRDELLNPHGVLHGGVIYSMADTGMGGALYSILEEGELCTTVEIKITYLAAVNSGMLICDTRVISRRSRIAILESQIENQGQMVARATGTFYIYDERRS
jgi:acyl-CoA thioesterase